MNEPRIPMPYPPELAEGEAQRIPLTVRISAAAYEWLRDRACREHRSISAEMAVLLDRAMEQGR